MEKVSITYYRDCSDQQLRRSPALSLIREWYERESPREKASSLGACQLMNSSIHRTWKLLGDDMLSIPVIVTGELAFS